MTGRKFAEWAGIHYSTFGSWWRARKKSQREELPTPATETATGQRGLKAFVAGERQKTVDNRSHAR
jgi:hypothetical protein